VKTRSDGKSGYRVTYRGRCTPITSVGIAARRVENYTSRIRSENKQVQRFGARVFNLWSVNVIQRVT